MDPLDHLTGPAADLLSRVDHLLDAAGAPVEHPVWPLLRRLRALPGEAARAVAELRPEPFAAAAAELRGLIRRYDHVAATLTADLPWEGGAAEAFAARRTALAEHLASGPESLVHRTAASADYLDAVAEWIFAARALLARTLAEVLTSAEAVAVVARPATGALLGVGAAWTAGYRPVASAGSVVPAEAARPLAAAEIGARVLAAVAEIDDRGEALRQRWQPGLAEAAFRPPAVDPGGLDGGVRIVF